MANKNEKHDKTMGYETDGGAEAASESLDPDPAGIQPGTQSAAETTVEDELKSERDRYLRLAAEFENYKKRVQRDLEDYRKYANERLLKELLPVLDNLQRALQHGRHGGNASGVLQGVELVSKKLEEVFSRFGLRPIASVGLPFDPAVHQAVATVESRGQAPNTVVEEYEKGYYLHDRVLRPATVTVTEAGQAEEQRAPESED